MRCVEGVRAERREREPVEEVRRREEGVSVVGREGDAGRRVREVGKEAVWKVVWGRRRWPERDLGSVWPVVLVER